MGFVQIPDEDAVAVRIIEPPDCCLWQLWLVEIAPVAGSSGQGSGRPVCKEILVVSTHIYDGIVDSIITADYVACLGDVLAAVQISAGSNDSFDFCLAGILPSGTGNQIAVNCQLVWRAAIGKNSCAHLKRSLIEVSHHVPLSVRYNFFG